MRVGQEGEILARDYLISRGYRIEEKNYRCPLGEIDAVARKDGRLVFVEIKTRTSDRFGSPEEAVDCRKQKKLERLAKWYLKEKKLENAKAAFAVVAVSRSGAGLPAFRLIENAFEIGDEVLT